MSADVIGIISMVGLPLALFAYGVYLKNHPPNRNKTDDRSKP